MPKNTIAWSYRKNETHRNSEKDVIRKAVCNKTKRKTKNEMAGWRVHGPEKDGNKRMEIQSKGSRGLEAYCKGGQGPPRAVTPSKKKNWSQSEKKGETTTYNQGNGAWISDVSQDENGAYSKMYRPGSKGTLVLIRTAEYPVKEINISEIR